MTEFQIVLVCDFSEILAIGIRFEHGVKGVVEYQRVTAIGGNSFGEACSDHDLTPAETVAPHLIYLVLRQICIFD